MEEIVERAKNKVEGAFDELILMLEKEMYLIARTRLNNDDDIADAMQETILKCFKNLHKLRDNSLFRTWTIKILINECNNIYRKRKKSVISIEENEIELEDKNNNDGNLAFYILIRNLNPEEKLILTLYYCSRYTTKEISQILKMKENTVKSRLVRARNKLRNECGGNENEGY